MIQLEKILLAIEQHGYIVVDDFLPGDVANQLRENLVTQHQKNRLHPAKVGRLNVFENPKIRGDLTLWLDQASKARGISAYFEAMETLKIALNKRFMFGLDQLEAHFALYPIGSFYQKHLDQFVTTHSQDYSALPVRKVSAVLYLNEHWAAEDGGELRLFFDETSSQIAFLDIFPLDNRLVLFLSETFWHEVRPAKRERLSVTGWFKTRDNRLL